MKLTNAEHPLLLDVYKRQEKGFMATLKDPNIKNKEGRTVFDISAFDFTKDKPAPDTVLSLIHI